jgi:L-alanine-DL-glutamate epimerase-like enolase superfamily enzyme
MKITEIRVQIVEYEREFYHWCDDVPVPPSTVRAPFLRILTDEGVEGHCFSASGAADGGIGDIASWLVGQDPLNRERIWQRFWKGVRGGLQSKLSAVDIALWDLAGKALGQPVYKLLGGYRDEMPAYASTNTLDSVEEYAELARECVAKGYRAFKLHIWGRPEDDVAACRIVRETVGNDVVLMLDASSQYSVEQALWVGRALEELDYYWLEEPIDHYNLSGLADLGRKLRIPLAVGEATQGAVSDAANHIKMGVGDIFLTDPTLKAGFTGAIKTAHLWEAFGLRCAVHGSGIACLQAALAIPSCRFFESRVPEGISQCHGIRTAATEVDANGFVRAWQAPGLGVEIDWDFVNRHTVATFESKR